jgi:hypothetical protein
MSEIELSRTEKAQFMAWKHNIISNFNRRASFPTSRNDPYKKLPRNFTPPRKYTANVDRKTKYIRHWRYW